MGTRASLRVISKNGEHEKIFTNFYTNFSGDPAGIPLDVIRPLQKINPKNGAQDVVSKILSDGYLDPESIINEFEFGNLDEDFLYEIRVIDLNSIEITVLDENKYRLFKGSIQEFLKFSFNSLKFDN